MDRFIILLANTARTAPITFYGHSGRKYRFLWHNEHRAMTYEGKVMEPEEFDKISPDLFAAEAQQNLVSPVPRRIPGAGGPDGESPIFQIPRFEHTELMRICEHIGALEQEVGKLRREVAFLLAESGKRDEADLLRLAQEIVARELGPQPVAVPVPPTGAIVTDYDPEDGIPPVSGGPAIPRPVQDPAFSQQSGPRPQMIPTKNPIPSLQEGDYDPDAL